MIRILQISKDLLKLFLLRAQFRRSQKFTDGDANRAPARCLRAADDEFAVLVKTSREKAMDSPRVCAPF